MTDAESDPKFQAVVCAPRFGKCPHLSAPEESPERCVFLRPGMDVPLRTESKRRLVHRFSYFPAPRKGMGKVATRHQVHFLDQDWGSWSGCSQC